MPVMQLKNVVFPAPLGPISATISCRLIVEIHLVERAQAAEIFGQIGYFEHRGVHAWPPVAGTSKADLELSILSLFVILYVRFSPEMRP